MNKNTSLGEGCGYDHWQLQIIDKVDEGQPGQLGKRWANLWRQITVAENDFNKKPTTFLTPTCREAYWQKELCTVGSQGLNSREERTWSEHFEQWMWRINEESINVMQVNRSYKHALCNDERLQGVKEFERCDLTEENFLFDPSPLKECN